MKYKVVKVEGTEFSSSSTLKQLEETVQAYCDDGWKPQGGVSITSENDYDLIFAQALIKEDERDAKRIISENL